MVFGDSEVDRANIRKAVLALQTYLVKKASESQGKSDLLETPEYFSIQLALRKVPEKGSNHPVLLNIPHSIRSEHDEICLFVRDADKKQIKEEIEKNPIPGLAKVLSLGKLRKNYARFEDKRKLCAAYDVFLADHRIIPSLTKPLGKTFFTRNKQPMSIRLRTNNLANEIIKARDSTQMINRGGPCVSIKVGHSNMEVDHIVANIVSSMQKCVERISKKWKNIQAIHVKTHDSIALPIFNALPEIGQKIEPVAKLPNSLLSLNDNAAEGITTEDEPEPEKKVERQGKRKQSEHIPDLKETTAKKGKKEMKEKKGKKGKIEMKEKKEKKQEA